MTDLNTDNALPSAQRYTIAIVAMGGQGGGVLSDWLVSLAEAQDWSVQATSVPGVAQRTGATIYYVEIFKSAEGEPPPVLALMPGSGDVDLVIAAEWMEAGRAIMRGIVTPDKTTLVASTHREFSTAEKIVPGDGMADESVIARGAKRASRKLIAFDMAALAAQNSSVVSAALFGAVAASGALPFEASHYQDAIKAGGIGVKASLAAFSAAHARALVADDLAESPMDQNEVGSDNSVEWLPLQGPLGNLLRAQLPELVWPFATLGVRRCIDFLDGDYARQYLDRLMHINAVGSAQVTEETARWLALRMCYEDPVRVAELKVRRQRIADIRGEVKAQDDHVVHHTEFLHPRIEEVADSLPVEWGQRLLASSTLQRLAGLVFGKGRTIKTSTVAGFATMYVMANMRSWRRRSLRHQREQEHIDNWLQHIQTLAAANAELGVATANLARLIKGYGDTHANGTSLFERLSGIANGLSNRSDGGIVLQRFIDAGLADATGQKLDEAIAQSGESQSGNHE